MMRENIATLIFSYSPVILHSVLFILSYMLPTTAYLSSGLVTGNVVPMSQISVGR
jgi:hypothetical protein